MSVNDRGRNEIPPQEVRGKIIEFWKYGVTLKVTENLDGNLKDIKSIKVSLDKDVINDSAEKSDNSEKKEFLDGFRIGEVATLTVPQDVKISKDGTIYLTVFSNLKKGV